MNKIYFAGIGGIGMSALARYYNYKGWKVYGYDKVETILTKKLVKEGMIIHYKDDIKFLEKDIDMVVYTPAIPKDHKELKWYKDLGYPSKKRAEVLGVLSENAKTIAIAGTHGKTSTSSLLAHILSFVGFDYTGFVGGISIDNNNNFIPGSDEWMLLEADEYDRSFLHLSPMIASLMSLDPDHLDIYGDKKGMLEGFKDFTYKIRKDGILYLRSDDEKLMDDSWRKKMKNKNIQIVTFGKSGDIRIDNLKIKKEKQYFDYKYKEWTIRDIELVMAGKHNVENTCVALSIALELGMDEREIIDAITVFKGVKRRFEYIMRTDKLVIIDDYAHHPTELNAVISAVKSLYPKKRVLGIFQPHLFTRTQDFYKEFAKELDELDETILLDIYPAREKPIEGITSEIILNEMKSIDKSIVNKEELLNFLKKRSFDVLLTIGAGDIGAMVKEITSILE